MTALDPTHPIDLSGVGIEIEMNEGGVHIYMAGNEITDMVSRCSWYWQKGHLPRLSLDISEITTLDLHSEVTTAKFRRKT